MPKYTYKCNNCSEILEIRHSMKDTVTDCSVCDVENVLKRIPSSFLMNKTDQKAVIPGQRVKEAIEDGKLALKLEKERLSKVTFEETDG